MPRWEDINTRFNDGYTPDPNSGCWLWLKSILPSGYGKIWHEGRLQPAHRVSYKLHIGEIPSGLLVMHTCDNRLCVNPRHLLLGTHRDNTHDMINKGRGNLKGELNSNNKLTRGFVLEIKDLLKCSLFTQKEIAEFYGVSQGAISLIKINKTWS